MSMGIIDHSFGTGMKLAMNGRMRAFALYAAVSFVTIIAIYYGADWWHLNDSPLWAHGKLMLLRVGAALLLSLAIAMLVSWLVHGTRRARLLFGGWLLAAALLFAAIWPGYLMTDSVSALKYSFEFPFNLWLGFFTPFYDAAVLQLLPNVAALVGVQLLLAAAVLAYACDTIVVATGRKAWALLFAVLVVCSPALVFNLGLQSRDTLFSLLVLWLAVFVVRTGQGIIGGAGSMLLAGCIGGLTVAVRSGDGWLVLLPLAVIVAWLTRSRRQSGLFAAAALTVLLFSALLSAKLGQRGDAFAYQVANTINPLGYVMQSKFSTDAGQHLGEIAKVVDVDKIRALQTPYEIPAWWSGNLIRESATPQQRDAYLGHVGGYLRENVGIFVAGRVHTFFAANGLSDGGFKVQDLYASGWPAEWIPPAKYHVDLAAGRPFPALAEATKSWIDGSAHFDPALTSGSALFWDLLPWIAVLLLVICFGPRVPGLRLAALLVFARVPVVFMTAPAAQFKYYLPVAIAAGFILVLALAGVFNNAVRPAGESAGTQ
jgi:hypothetical protein